MHRYPHLRVAYIDSIRLNPAGASAHETYHICLLLAANDQTTHVLSLLLDYIVKTDHIASPSRHSPRHNPLLFNNSNIINKTNNNDNFTDEVSN